MSFVLGVDIGGSHITAAWVNLNDRVIITDTYKRKSINANGSAEKILKDWCDVINDAFNTLPDAPRTIGIAMPGPFNYEDGISLIKDQNKFKALYKVNVKEALGKRLNVEADCIRFMNDAACFLQGEIFCGAAKNLNHVLGLTLGTGLGSAVCNNGLAQDAALWKSAFKNGIAEDYFSTRWFVSRYKTLSGKLVSGVKELINEKDAPLIKQLFLEFSENMAMFLTSQMQTFNYESVVFGGNISNAITYFLPELQSILSDNKINILITKSLLNETAALIGAASVEREIADEKLSKLF